jgi:hypothetical protein
MIRLALFAVATYAACRMTKAIIDENRERFLLPAPSVSNRSPKDVSVASTLKPSARNG